MTLSLEEVRRKIMFGLLGSCSCVTKTPDYRHHRDDCRYPVLCEVGEFIEEQNRVIEDLRKKVGE